MKFLKCIKKPTKYCIIEWDGGIETIAYLNSILQNNEKEITIEYGMNDYFAREVIVSVLYYDVDKIVIEKDSICKSRGKIYLTSAYKREYYIVQDIVQENESYKVNIEFWSKDAFKKCFEIEEDINEKNDKIVN